MAKKKLDEQITTITRGAVELIGEDELRGKLSTGETLRVKAGFDPTSADLHLGHTVVLEKLRQFQELGHQVVFLIGDFTAGIGDPSGQSKTRPELTPEQIDDNARTYAEQAFKILDADKTEVRRNSEWFAGMSAADMLALAGEHTVSRMTERDDFEKRLAAGDPVGIHEFLYPLVQAYDSVALEADVEVGGTDQKFNLLVGRDLQRRRGLAPQAVLTMPLIEGLDGKQKMSKSLGNAVGISDEPGDMYGKLMSASDELMFRYYELLSECGPERLDEIRQGRVHPMEAKKALAAELTARYHGTEAAGGAAQAFAARFQKGQLPDDIPEFVWPGGAGSPGEKVGICRLMREAGLVASASEARRLIAQGAVKLGGKRVGDHSLELEARGQALIEVGKRRIVRVSFEG
ncbi:MAG: tyrosine--tRNA ligase [Deltaproteobacteria bacterium]